MALLTTDQVDTAHQPLQWSREGDELVRVVKCKGFAGSLKFVNAVGELAEIADHHPDIDIRWDTVTLRLSTHSEGGLTQKDVDLATAIDKIGV